MKKPKQPRANVATLVDLSTRLFRLDAAIDKAIATHDDEAATRAFDSHSKVDEALDVAITQLLVDKKDDILDMAVDTLYGQNKVDQAESLHASITMGCSRQYTTEDEAAGLVCHELLIVPVLVSVQQGVEACLNQTTVASLVTLAQTYFEDNTPTISGTTTQVTIDPRLWHPNEVYPLTFSDVYRLNLAPSPETLSLRGAAPSNPPTATASAVIGLRFLAMWLRTPLGLDLDNDEQDDDVDMGETINGLDAHWLTSAAQQLALCFGEPAQVGLPNNVLDARDAGMELNHIFDAHLNISTQLKMHGLSGTPLDFYVSLHGDPALGSDGGLVEQVRISLLDAHGRLAAGHVLELNEWFGSDEASDMALSLLTAYGKNTMHSVEDLHELSDDEDDPRFYTEHGWVTMMEADPHGGTGGVMLH